MNQKWYQASIIKLIFKTLGIFYAATLIYIFFFARRRWRVFPKRNFNLIPFRDKIYFLHTNQTPINSRNLEFYKDLVGNVVIFIPLPFLLFYITGIRSYRKILVIGILISLAVEIIQYVFNIGVADIDDVILNTTGAIIGLVMLYYISGPENNLSSTSAGVLEKE
ncbi:MAG: VanZ family protein [Chitinophagaceae bacterium]